jgi:peptidoglycan/LPS O-acetylase OafA/YrhL
LQLLRGVAALMVTCHHALEEANYTTYALSPPDWVVRIGAAGVDIFFVVSGFIMMYVSFPPGAASKSPGRFLLERAVRIYPLYWCCCLLTLALIGIGLFRSKNPSLATLAPSLLLLPSREPLIGVAWTLVYEVYFYLVFAATLAFRSRAVSALLTALLLLLGYGLSGSLPPGSVQSFLKNEIAFEFCLGLCLGWGAQRLPQRLFGQSLALLLGVLGLTAASLWFPARNTSGLDVPGRLLGWGLPALAIVIVAVRARPDGSWLAHTGRMLGDASYAIYLTHVFVMVTYAKLLRLSPAVAEMSQWPALVLVVVGCTLLGITTHWYVEQPLLRRLRGFSSMLRRS